MNFQWQDSLKVNVLGGQFGTFHDFPLIWCSFFELMHNFDNFSRRILKVFENLSEKLRKSATCRAFGENIIGVDRYILQGWIEQDSLQKAWCCNDQFCERHLSNCEYLLSNLWTFECSFLFVGSEACHRCPARCRVDVWSTSIDVEWTTRTVAEMSFSLQGDALHSEVPALIVLSLSWNKKNQQLPRLF